MKILYILKHNPWGIGGGCYACRNYLEAFVEIFKGGNIDVLACAEYLTHGNTDEFPNIHFVKVGERKLFDKLLSPLTGEMHRFQSAAIQMLRLNDYDFCIFDHNCIAGTLVDVCKAEGVKTVVLNHNCELEYYRDNHPSLLNRLLLLPVVRRNEKRAYQCCDFNIFLTKEDEELFAQLYGKSETVKVVGGCFMKKGEQIDGTALKPFNRQKLKMVISGTIGNVQNLDGINYFLNELYPCVPKDVDVVIAGKNPPAELVDRLKEFRNIELIANPKDMNAIVSGCDIFLCPARLGGGVKIRVMDGLRNGLPVLAHSVSARGYHAFELEEVMAEFESKEQFAKSLHKMLGAIRSGAIAKDRVLKVADNIFSFESAIKRISCVIKS
ncbi:MAG: glycosyltransferase [Prevotella sp.]|nr:glycosyltransferase [Prevotella sp.]